MEGGGSFEVVMETSEGGVGGFVRLGLMGVVGVGVGRWGITIIGVVGREGEEEGSRSLRAGVTNSFSLWGFAIFQPVNKPKIKEAPKTIKTPRDRKTFFRTPVRLIVYQLLSERL